MSMKLYELAGADPDLRFSPYCWRTRLALAHKGLSAEGIPWRFTEAARLAFADSERVPVLVDGARAVADSWRIAEYLDDTYPDLPSILGPREGRAHVRFINTWADTMLHPAISRCVLTDIHAVLTEEGKAYFRLTREKAFGRSLEEVVADRDTAGVAALRAALQPVRALLRLQPWIGGQDPDYADYIVLGSLQWPRTVSRFALLAEDDPVAIWQRRGLALFGGMLEQAPRVGWGKTTHSTEYKHNLNHGS
jgi:glutathione S-transferase